MKYKYANVEGQRREAEPGLRGECPICRAEMVAKCGEIRVWHWAHQSKQDCDHWWESESDWHRAWKNEFPADWQEYVQRAKDGEKHIADVKTSYGWVIEFQHSPLRPEERRAREAFYGQMVWVVDGRRERDRLQFDRALESGTSRPKFPSAKAVFADECRLLREWADCRSYVFFDFGNDHLWFLIPESLDGRLLIDRTSRAEFVEAHRKGTYRLGLQQTAEIEEPPATNDQPVPPQQCRPDPLRPTPAERRAARKSGVRLQRRM